MNNGLASAPAFQTLENPMKLALRLFAAMTLMISQGSLAQRKGTVPAGFIEFTPIRITLGMPKDRTISLLSEHYEVSMWKGGDVEDSWAVSEKTGNHIVLGTLSFVNGVLIWVARFWNVEDSAYSLAHTMSVLIDQLRDEGFANCTIATRKEPTPSVETEVIGINCGQKGIIVQADQIRNKDVRTVDVLENLEAAVAPSH
jgi:hypothetical protein